MRTGTLSAVRWTSVSTEVTPRSNAASSPGNVFSGLSPRAPRWPWRSKVVECDAVMRGNRLPGISLMDASTPPPAPPPNRTDTWKRGAIVILCAVVFVVGYLVWARPDLDLNVLWVILACLGVLIVLLFGSLHSRPTGTSPASTA